MFSINEKVVCIHTFIRDREDIQFGVMDPIKGEMYTIREIAGEYLRFHEIINPKLHYTDGYKESAYHYSRFRKLDYDFVDEVMVQIKEFPVEV